MDARYNERGYYQLEVLDNVAELYIFGDITSFPVTDGDTSAADLSEKLNKLAGITTINVHINSYGGEVAEGLAIYNTLRNFPAQVTTMCEGFACSVASVIFMAGEERIMREASLLMIHNAWTCSSGDANALRKTADELEIINEASKKAYLSRVQISEEELTALLDAGTFLTPESALDMGFATAIDVTDLETEPEGVATQSALPEIIKRLVGGESVLQTLKHGINRSHTEHTEQAEDDDDKKKDPEEPDAPEEPNKEEPPADPDREEPDDDPDDPDDDKRPKQMLQKLLMKGF